MVVIDHWWLKLLIVDWWMRFDWWLVIGTAEAITVFEIVLLDSFVHLSAALQNSALVWSDLNSDGTMTPSGFYTYHFWNMRIAWIHPIFRFSDKNQKAIDLLRTKCLKLKCMVSLNTVCHIYTAIIKFTYIPNWLFPQVHIYIDISEFVWWKTVRDHERQLWACRPHKRHPHNCQQQGKCQFCHLLFLNLWMCLSNICISKLLLHFQVSLHYLLANYEELLFG